jgi:ADP-heptose:LPS heptosyltransferase
MRGRLRQICQGVNVDPGAAEQYRQLWRGEASKTPLPLIMKCPHLGEPIKQPDGENKKEVCEPCGGKSRQVFACSHPALEPHETTMPGCQACEYRPRQIAQIEIPTDVKPTTMLIAHNGTPENQVLLGDSLCSLKVAWLFAENAPDGCGNFILSLSLSNPFNVFWRKFIDDFRCKVIYDNFAPNSKEDRFAGWDSWRGKRKIAGQNFEHYREIYRRIDGGPRQQSLCGSERGLSRKNIFEFFYHGQENFRELTDSDNLAEFGDGMIYHPKRTGELDVFLAPLARCQGNHVFTFEFWTDVVEKLIAAGLSVTVNHDGIFCEHLQGREGFRKIYPGNDIEGLVAEVCRHKLVACGNTGIGWLAAACGVPLVAMQREDNWMPDYKYENCGVKSLVALLAEPDADSVARTIQDQLRRPRHRQWKTAARKVRPIILKHHLCHGDVLVMSAAIRSLHEQHPGKFLTAIDTNANVMYEYNPDVTPIEEVRAMGGEEIEMGYPNINHSDKRAIHFMGAYCDFLSSVLKVPIPLLTNRPHVYLSKRERGWMDQVQQVTGKKQKFWLVNAGVKSDITTKQYPWYQEVIDRLQGKVLFAQVGRTEHMHKPLRGVVNLLDQTDDRQLMRMVYHSEGVLCGTTFLMHLAAALEKPAVILAGGREPRSWNTYPLQTLISTIGALPCCAKSACWKSRTVKLNDGAAHDICDNCLQNGVILDCPNCAAKLCSFPTFTDPPSPKCMAIVSPAEVSEKILLHCS